MNDYLSEAEARQLLAAAADTIPPAPDLLSAVRRRRARRRVRARTATAGMLAVAAGGGTLLGLSGAHGSPPPPLTARAELTSILARTRVQTFRIRAVLEQIFLVHGQKYGFRLFDQGAFDPARQTGEDTVTGNNVDANGYYRYIGKYEYSSPDFTLKSGHGRPWYKFVAAPNTNAIDAGESATWDFAAALAAGDAEAIAVGPHGLLPLIESATSVRDDGPVSGPGWTGTEYSFTATVGSPHAPQTVYGTLSVDEHGQVRHMRVSLTTVSSGLFQSTQDVSDITFSDFGMPVTVVAPPPSQIHLGAPPLAPPAQLPRLSG